MNALARIRTVFPSLSRSLVTSTVPRPVPTPQGSIQTPADFLKAIGRSSDNKCNIESWDEFWKSRGPDFKKAGLGVRDRRYVMWCMEKYRGGLPVEEFAHEMKPKKKIRGWGPAVQFGKRIRSKRTKT